MKTIFKVNANVFTKGIAALLYGLFIALFFITISCEKELPVNPPIVDPSQEEPLNLTGTTWKLAAYVHVETGTEILPLPDSTICPRCFSFTFDTDSTATGWSSGNYIEADLKPILGIWAITAAYDSQIGNTALFYEAGKSLVAFSLEDDQMKLFYNDKKDYMLFKKQQ